MSYPSGHVANALVWYGVIALLAALLLVGGRLRRGRCVAAAGAAAGDRLLHDDLPGFHWITDSVAGAAPRPGADPADGPGPVGHDAAAAPRGWSDRLADRPRPQPFSIQAPAAHHPLDLQVR